MLENRVLRRIFGPKRDEVTRDQAKEDEMGTNGEKRNVCRTSAGKPGGKRPLGREIGWGGMDWIVLSQDKAQWSALVNTVMNLRVPLNAGNFWSSFSRSADLHGVS
jgi:hypothetical protein